MKLKAFASEEKRGQGNFSCIVKGSLIGLCVSLVGILFFAFILRFTNISDSIISPVNQVIKGVSIFFGVFVGMKNRKNFGFVNGLLIGLFFTLIAFLVFSVLAGQFCFDRALLNDLTFGCVMGAICGIICVNIKKN